jgi:hypothetical protein
LASADPHNSHFSPLLFCNSFSKLIIAIVF